MSLMNEGAGGVVGGINLQPKMNSCSPFILPALVNNQSNVEE